MDDLDNGFRFQIRYVCLGLLAGAVNFGTLVGAAAWAMRAMQWTLFGGLYGPGRWYELPVFLVLMLGPFVLWAGWILWRMAHEKGPWWRRALAWLCYVSAEPAMMGLLWLAVYG